MPNTAESLKNILCIATQIVCGSAFSNAMMSPGMICKVNSGIDTWYLQSKPFTKRLDQHQALLQNRRESMLPVQVQAQCRALLEAEGTLQSVPSASSAYRLGPGGPSLPLLPLPHCRHSLASACVCLLCLLPTCTSFCYYTWYLLNDCMCLCLHCVSL